MACFPWLGGRREVTSRKFLACHREELVCGRGQCRVCLMEITERLSSLGSDGCRDRTLVLSPGAPSVR